MTGIKLEIVQNIFENDPVGLVIFPDCDSNAWHSCTFFRLSRASLQLEFLTHFALQEFIKRCGEHSVSGCCRGLELAKRLEYEGAHLRSLEKQCGFESLVTRTGMAQCCPCRSIIEAKSGVSWQPDGIRKRRS